MACLLAIVGVGGVTAQYVLGRNTRIYEVPVGGQEVVALSDGSKMTLNTGARVAVRYTAGTRRIDLQRGEAFFDVASNVERPFIVSSESHQVRALGTAFSVSRTETDLAVTLVHGRVGISPIAWTGAAAKAVYLAPGQAWDRRTNRVRALTQQQIAASLAWRDRELVFDGAPLAEAVADVNRYSSLRITIDDQAVARLRVSGVFRSGESEAFARTVGAIYGLAVTRDGGAIHLSSSVENPSP